MNGLIPKMALSADQFALCCSLRSHLATVYYTVHNPSFICQPLPTKCGFHTSMTLALLGRFPTFQPWLSGDLILRSSNRECAASLPFCGPLPASIFRSCPPSLPAGSYLANSPANRGRLLLLIFLDSTSRFEQTGLALRFLFYEAALKG